MGPQRRRRLILVGIFIVTVAASLAGSRSRPPRVVPGPPARGGLVRLPLAELGANVRYFSHPVPGSRTRVRYFVVPDAQGRPHVALDACARCYPAGRGFRLVGEAMRCAHCGRNFAVDSLEAATSDCAPRSVSATVVGGQLVIHEDALLAGARYF